MVTKRIATDVVAQEDISRWMDEGSGGDTESIVLLALKSDAGRSTWALYHHIGDVLRDDAKCSSLSEGFTSRVMQKLEAEPTVRSSRAIAMLRNPVQAKPYYRAWALAATVAGAAVVGWMAFIWQNEAGMTTGKAANTAEKEVAPPGVPPVIAKSRETPESEEDPMALVPVESPPIRKDYLDTHQELSPPAWQGFGGHQRDGETDQPQAP